MSEPTFQDWADWAKCMTIKEKAEIVLSIHSQFIRRANFGIQE